MEIKRLFRILSAVFLVILLAASISSCRLAASEGPEETAVEELPVPGETEEPAEIEIVPTATVQASVVKTKVVEPTQPVAITETPLPATATATPPVYVQVTPGVPTEYELKYGEFPFCIARRFNVNQYELLAINGLGLNTPTYVGMIINIPQTGNPFDGEPTLKDHPAEYTVRSGETLEIIACDFGDVSPDMIAMQNNLEAPYTLTAGQVLIIP